MKLLIITRFLYVLLIFFCQSYTTLQAHGFCAHTFVKQCNISKAETILSICQKAVKGKKVCIPNYNVITSTQLLHKKVLKGGQSSVPWYVRFSCTETNQDQIACSPLQEFYSLDVNKWIPAYQLKIGDYLQSYRGFCTVTSVEYVEKELKVYALEVEPPHTFFVGNDELLTHNMMLPESWVILAPAITFGSSAALSVGSGAVVGATLAPILAPAVITAGLVLSGALSAFVKMICGNNIPQYHATVPNIHNFSDEHQKQQGKKDIKEEAGQSANAGSPSGGPKKNGDKDKNTKKEHGKGKKKIKMSDNENDRMHIFRKASGHVSEETPTTKKLFEDVSNKPDNYQGMSMYGQDVYFEDLPNGDQVWTQVRNGKIKNAGINRGIKATFDSSIPSGIKISEL